MAAKRKSTKSSSTATKKRANTPEKRQLKAVIWFALAVFFLFVVLIKGQNVWTWIHNQIFGIFGVMAFLFPVLLGFVAVTYAFENISSSAKLKAVGSAALAVLIDATVDVFSRHQPNATFWGHIVDAYSSGMSLKSGGFLGALIGHPLYVAFGSVGAAITLILLIFVLIMVITGTTLMSFFKGMYKPVKTISEQAENAYHERQEKRDKKKGKAIENAVRKGLRAAFFVRLAL